MDLHAELSYPADPETVIAMLTDADYVRLRSERTGGSEVTVDIQPEGTGTVVTSERTLPTDGFPSIARKFVGEGLRVRQVDRWAPVGDGTWAGESEVDAIASAPVRLRAKARLEPTESGSVQVIDGTVKASVPFVSGKLEALVHEQVLRAMRVEEQVAAEWLVRRT